MQDRNLGVALATLIAAPVVIVCCGGGMVLLASLLTSVGIWWTGANILKAALVGVIVGIGFLIFRSAPKFKVTSMLSRKREQ